MLNEFQTAYVEQNATRVKTQFRSSDTVMILAYAIVMLHTDMYSPNVRQQSKMTRDEFIRNLRGVDSGEDLDRDLLIGIYNRMKSKEMSVQSDHTDQVRKIQQHLTGPLKPLNLSVPQRRLVCYCRLYEVSPVFFCFVCYKVMNYITPLAHLDFTRFSEVSFGCLHGFL
ncbi:unnamed protein product [Trichobilharzia regenti]|nr:unnamed protein product [Trichobilharzia regenti]